MYITIIVVLTCFEKGDNISDRCFDNTDLVVVL